ncbi:MAG: hypothetical protein U9M92_01205 [Patescibacteria group bacterium]|nr:hypothetical protein [Patescibacteria group bacterium]
MIKKISFLIFLCAVVFSGSNVVQAEDDDSGAIGYYSRISAISAEVAHLGRLIGIVSGAYIPKAFSDKDYNRVITGGVTWLMNAQEDDGHLKYEYLPYEDRYLDDDNTVRQAGSLYGLGEVIRNDKGANFDIADTVERSIEYFENQTVAGTLNGQDFKCIVRYPGDNMCKLGATSLALVGILGYVEAYPDRAATYSDLIDEYMAYVIAAKKEGAGFSGVYRANRDTQNTKESSYSNGEALLALVRYYRYQPSAEVEETIDDMIAYISSDVEFDSSLYLWAMAAIKDATMLWPEKEYLSYVKAYTDWRIAPFRSRRMSTHNYCAYIEGVISAYSVLEPAISESEKRWYTEEIDFWLDQSAGLQVSEKRHARIISDGGVGIVKRMREGNKERALGGFLTGWNEATQRIDFTQHCLNSYLQKLVDIDGNELTSVQ